VLSSHAIKINITNSEENGSALRKGLSDEIKKNHPYSTKHHEVSDCSGTDISVLHNNIQLHRYSRQQFTVLIQIL
jgi:hypothetical protein